MFFRSFVMALVVLCAQPALAAPSAADIDAARGLMKQGREERAKGNHALALERFSAAHKIMNVPTTGLEVGVELAEVGKLVEARETWIAVTKLPVEPKEPEAFARAREKSKELADAILPRIPAVKLTILHAVGPFTLTVDGVEVPKETLLLPRRMNPGAHTLVVTDGAHRLSQSLSLVEHDEKALTLDLEQGEALKLEPLKTEPPKTEPSKTEPVKIVPHDEPATRSTLRTPLVWGGFGLATVGIVVGSVAGLVSLKHSAALDDHCEGFTCDKGATDDLSTARSWARVSNVSFVIAGVGAVAGVIGWMLPDGRGTVTAGLGTVTWTASF